MGKTAVTMTVTIAELAQSYIAHATSSGRCRPSRRIAPRVGDWRGGAAGWLTRSSLIGPVAITSPERPRSEQDRVRRPGRPPLLPLLPRVRAVKFAMDLLPSDTWDSLR